MKGSWGAPTVLWVRGSHIREKTSEVGGAEAPSSGPGGGGLAFLTLGLTVAFCAVAWNYRERAKLGGW